MVKQSTNLSSYMLDNDFSSSYIGPKHTVTYKSQLETILVDLNQHMAKTLHLSIFLTDDATMYTCNWLLD